MTTVSGARDDHRRAVDERTAATSHRPAAALPSREQVMGKHQNENFTVASAVLGHRRRMHLLAIYGFARLVDDVGDEAAGDRGALLDEVEAQLDDIYRGKAAQHAVMAALAPAIRECHLPDGPFRRLIEANRRDQVVTRYDTFEQLLEYCQLSAAPVGELVLHVFGLASPARTGLSDRVCAGLQVVEHLQDVGEDYGRGRVYLPREDVQRFGCSDKELAAAADPNATPSTAYRALIAFEAQRASRLLSEGAPLARTLPPRPRLAVAGFVAGGRAALDSLQRTMRQRGAPHRQRSAGDGRTRRDPRPRVAFAVAFAKAASGR
jgi:squalene synthase HpnC